MENAVSVAFVAARPRSKNFPPGHSAEVTPFPQPATRPIRSPEAVTTASKASESTLRMRAAMEKLQAALEKQRAAVALWRISISEARTSVEALDRSMTRYQSQLAAIDLKPLKQSSLQLAAIMDRALTARG